MQLRKWRASMMETEAKGYAIHDLKTGQVVALIGADGTVQDEGDPQAVAVLKTLMRRDLVVRESQLGNEGRERDNWMKSHCFPYDAWSNDISLKDVNAHKIDEHAQCDQPSLGERDEDADSA